MRIPCHVCVCVTWLGVGMLYNVQFKNEIEFLAYRPWLLLYNLIFAPFRVGCFYNFNLI